ncbi:hypothetical protein [Alicyclobacillus acidoterrestris]|uniref:Uncharacterized protein n=1 Tax=Alicyclobacillus acidoterrestris (strain ATCC 49025 / DSM 3922 / CIP 106132 / NCIMB 13137 / GD3B) TaxID=1356854 RepID=T0BL04_ALIAG|nr:hypothetical protein [Alicyclobacillus acidoterrestris]EPZ44663.1 hypothetical protein N007_10525 [Alicyclobacillus acidoterrestris ATCC 49025]UNO50321.1 hypothetical protein K1I37_07555 [Alicyclobacillus acidoterrestris]
MQWNTFIKLGSLAFDVASDQKVRELAGIVHHGARRRGLLGVPPHAQTQGTSSTSHTAASTPNHWPKQNHPIPFAPGSHAPASQTSQSAPSKSAHSTGNANKSVTEKPTAATNPSSGEFDLKNWVTMENAKKVLGWAGSVTQFLTK